MKTAWTAILLLGIVHSAMAATTTLPANTPEAFIAAYRQALRTEDPEILRGLFMSRTPGERAMVDVLIANEIDTAKLTAAAEKAFGVKLVGGGTILPPNGVREKWKIENDLAFLPDPRGQKSIYPPLRMNEGRYRIDLVANRMDWMDKPEAGETRRRYRSDPTHIDVTLRALADGRYRTVEELRDATSGGELLDRASDSPPGTPPRAFRRPVKVDLSTPLAALRTHCTAIAEGDGEAVLRCIEIVDPADEAQLKAAARRISSVATIQEAALKKFGVAVIAPAELPNERIGALQMLVDLDDFEHRKPETDEDVPLVIQGDEAQWKETGDVVSELARMNGQWKIRSRFKAEIGKKEDDPNDWAMIYNLVAQVEEDIARRIADGEFATEKDALAAMDKAARAATSAPATRP